MCRCGWTRGSGLWGCAGLQVHEGNWEQWGHSPQPGCRGYVGKEESCFLDPQDTPEAETARHKKQTISYIVSAYQYKSTHDFTLHLKFIWSAGWNHLNEFPVSHMTSRMVSLYQSVWPWNWGELKYFYFTLWSVEQNKIKYTNKHKHKHVFKQINTSDTAAVCI